MGRMVSVVGHHPEMGPLGQCLGATVLNPAWWFPKLSPPPPGTGLSWLRHLKCLSLTTWVSGFPCKIPLDPEEKNVFLSWLFERVE